MTPALSAMLKLLSSLHLGKAIAAVHRAIISGLEGHTSLAAASCAGCGEEVTGTTSSILACVAASLAALRLVLEATLCIELLLARGEYELITALFAN